MEAVADPNVAIPISWFLGVIATLGGVIGVLAREIMKLQNNRADTAAGYTERVLTALNDNTNALNNLTDALSKKESV